MNLAINNNLVDSRRSVPLRDLFDGLDLDISYSVKQIGITGLANDSRKVRPGDLFFAVPGFVTDGAKYISEGRVYFMRNAVEFVVAIEGLENLIGP